MRTKDIIKLAGTIVRRQERTTSSIIEMIDFSSTRGAAKHRAFMVDIANRVVLDSGFTTHGRRSGSKAGRNLVFSNKSGSFKSSIGLMRIGEKYKSMKFKRSYRIDGLEPEVNGNVRRRAIVQHTSYYADESYMSKNKYPGRSLGCPALGHKLFKKWEDRRWIRRGRLLYIISDRDLRR